MSKNRFITLALFFSISFSVLHDFTIDVFSKGDSSVSQYVSEANHASKLEVNGDVSTLHYLFHVPMLLTLSKPLPLPISRSSKIKIAQETYAYTYKTTFLKPPTL